MCSRERAVAAGDLEKRWARQCHKDIRGEGGGSAPFNPAEIKRTCGSPGSGNPDERGAEGEDRADDVGIAHIAPAEFGVEDPEGPFCGGGDDPVAEQAQFVNTTVTGDAQLGIVQPTGSPIRVSTHRGFSFPFACVCRFSPPCCPWFPTPVVQFAWGDAQYRGLS